MPDDRPGSSKENPIPLGGRANRFDPAGGQVYQTGKIVRQDGRILHDGISSTAADNLVASYNTERNQYQAHLQSLEELGVMADYQKEMLELNFDFAEQTAERNIERFPTLAKLSEEQAGTTGNALNTAMREAFEGALDTLYPDWRTDIVEASGTAQRDSIEMTEAFRENILPKAMEAADEMSRQALDMVNAQLRGEIPDDVAAQLRRQAAEISQQIGVRGQAAQYLTARDLGRTSMDIQQQGLANAPAALGLGSQAYSTFAQTLQNPVTTGVNMTNLLKAYMAPQADIQNLYGTNMAVLSGSTLVPAGTAMQVGATTIANAGQLAQSAMQNSLEYQSQSYWNGQNYIMQKEAIAAQKSAAKLGVWGGVAQGLGQGLGQAAGAAAAG